MSSFGNAVQVRYSTPDMRPGHSGMPRHVGQQGVADPGVSAWAGGRTCVVDVSREMNNLLFVFTKNVSNFQMWTDRLIDHLRRSTQAWRPLLSYLAKSQIPIRKGWLCATQLKASTHGTSPPCSSPSLSITSRRTCIDTTSLSPEVNSAMGWRYGDLLHIEYRGRNYAIELRGVRRLQEFQRCFISRSLVSISTVGWTS